MGRESSTRQASDNDNSGSFFESCNSEELEAIFNRDFCPPNSGPSDSGTTILGNTSSSRMSFAKWTPEDWTCVYCTYVNVPLHLTCAICGKAKDAPTTPDGGCGDDSFLEQLKRERHAEMMELQFNILRDAEIERSSRSHGTSTSTGAEPSDGNGEALSTTPVRSPTRPPSAQPRIPNQIRAHSPKNNRKHEPTSPLYDTTCDRETQELLKMLSMQAENATGDTQHLENKSTSGNNSENAANLSLKPPPPSQARKGGSTKSRLEVRTGNRRRAPQPDENTSLDSDVMAKIAARSYTGAARSGRVRLDMHDDVDMPNLTKMIDTSAAASSQPGAYLQRSGVQPVRASPAAKRRSLSPKTRVSRVGITSSGQTQDGTDLDDDILRKIAANTHSSTHCQLNGAQDGTDLDDDILRKIAANTPASSPRQHTPAKANGRGGGEAQSEDNLDEGIPQKIAAYAPVNTRQYQNDAEGIRPGAHDDSETSKNSAPVSPTASVNETVSSPPSSGKTGKQGGLRKAANGLMKFGMPFRKQKGR
jgi:hypothetical protein